MSQHEKKKILIVRFSAIGDIVLTSPVVRSIAQARPDWEIHFATKAAFIDILQYNPYIHQIHLLKDSFSDLIKSLRKESFDHILDLHHNLRTLRLKASLMRPATAFHKQNFQKYLMVRVHKKRKILPHIVERYGATLKDLDLQLDAKGLDFFLPSGLEEEAQNILIQHKVQNPIAIVLGGTHATKRWLTEYFVKLINDLGRPVILLGGKDMQAESMQISAQIKVPHLNAAGTYSLLLSAALMKQSNEVLTHDTGFMHIAAAFGQKVYVLWGNTIPEFGMTPYKTDHINLEVQALACRPCSKIGFESCPEKHFNCIRFLRPEKVLAYMKNES